MMTIARNVLRRVVVPALLLAAWFVTMIGGWADIGRAIAVEPGPHGGDPDAEPIGGTVLAGGDLFGMPTRLEVAGGELLVLDRYRSEPVVALDRRSGRLLRSFGREGDGPGEFRSPVSFVTDGSGVAVLDVGLNRVTRLASGPDGFTLRATTQLALESAATDLVLTPGGDFLVSGFIADGRLARVDRDGGLVAYEGRPAGLDGLPPERRMEALQGTLRATPARDRLVRTRRFASRLEIVDTETATSLVAWGPERFEPRNGDYETRFGYLDSAPLADGFLALYSGRTREAFPDRANYGAIIHEFGWDGRLLAEHRLDSDVIAIAWSEEDGLLYAARHDPVPEIVVYSLDR
jgi:hypothetical protein